jgi:hypothetical protein
MHGVGRARDVHKYCCEPHHTHEGALRSKLQVLHDTATDNRHDRARPDLHRTFLHDLFVGRERVELLLK